MFCHDFEMNSCFVETSKSYTWSSYRRDCLTEAKLGTTKAHILSLMQNCQWYGVFNWHYNVISNEMWFLWFLHRHQNLGPKLETTPLLQLVAYSLFRRDITVMVKESINFARTHNMYDSINLIQFMTNKLNHQKNDITLILCQSLNQGFQTSSNQIKKFMVLFLLLKAFSVSCEV